MSKALADHAIPAIDLLAANLYPFEADGRGRRGFRHCIEKIDIGGPALIRAAAKNHDSVTVVVDPADYGSVLAEMAANGGATTLGLRKALAASAFARTAAYDAAIAAWFAETLGELHAEDARDFRHACRGAPLRREPASMGGLLPDRRAALRRRDRAPGPGQGALLQQSQRHRRGLRAGRRIRSFVERGRRHHQACQSVRRGGREDASPGLREGARLRSGERVRRDRRAQPERSMPTRRARSSRSSPRSSSRPTRATRPRRSSPRRRICGSCSPAGFPIRRPTGSRSARSRAAFLVQSRDNGVVSTARIEDRDQAQAERRGAWPT